MDSQNKYTIITPVASAFYNGDGRMTVEREDGVRVTTKKADGTVINEFRPHDGDIMKFWRSITFKKP